MNVDALIIAERLGIPFAIIVVLAWFGVKYAWPFVVERMKIADSALIVAQNSLVSAHDKLIGMIKDQTKVNTETIICLEEISVRLKGVEDKTDVILEILQNINGVSYTKESNVGDKNKD